VGRTELGTEQYDVDARGAGQHVADEALVAWHVDEAEPDVVLLQMGKAEVDADAALLLFFEPVGIDAGQGVDERSLAMVDMSRRADDNVLHAVIAPFDRRLRGHFGTMAQGEARAAACWSRANTGARARSRPHLGKVRKDC